MTFSANRMYTLFRLFWQLHQSSPCRIQKYRRSLCHTSPKHSLPDWFQILNPFVLIYKIYLNQTVNRLKYKELSANTTPYLHRAEVCPGSFSNTEYVWFWSKLQLGSLCSCHFLLSLLNLGNLLDKNLMLPLDSWLFFFFQKGICAKLGEYLPDATEEPICLDPKVVQSGSSVLFGLSLKQQVFFYS